MKDLRDVSGTVIELLGIETVEVSKDRVVLRMPVTAKTHQPMGMLHGGVSVLLAETAATVGAWMNIDHDRQMAVGIEINASHIRGKRDGTVTATATPRHIGQTTSVWDITITDENDQMICCARCTLAIVAKKNS